MMNHISLVDLINNKFGNKSDLRKNISDKFFDFSHATDIREFSFTSMTISSKGGGKTFLSGAMSQKLLELDDHIFEWKDEKTGENLKRERNVAYLLVPDSFIKNLKENMITFGFGEYAEKIRKIKKIREILNNDIVIIDEGVIGINGKRALTKEMANFEDSISAARHHRVIFLLNAIHGGVLAAYRKSCDMEIYKRFGNLLIREMKKKDPWFKQNEHILRKLKVQEAIVISDYNHHEMLGKIFFEYLDIIPYFTDNLSQNLAGTSFSIAFDRFKEINVIIDRFGKIVYDFFGDDIKKTRMLSVVKMFLRKKYPQAYYDYVFTQDYSKHIYETALYLHKMKELEIQEEADLEIQDLILVNYDKEFEIKDDILLRSLKLNPLHKKVYRHYKLSQNQVKTALKFGKSQPSINGYIKKVKYALSRAKGYYYERHRFRQMEKEINPANGDLILHTGEDDYDEDLKPDIILLQDNQILVYSIKLRDSYDGKMRVPKEKVRAEIDFCVELENTINGGNIEDHEFGKLLQLEKFDITRLKTMEINCIFHVFSYYTEPELRNFKEREFDYNNPPRTFVVSGDDIDMLF